MESNGSHWAVEAETILDQLLQFAATFAEFENDPKVDIRRLSEECAKRTEALKRILPDDFKDSAETGGEVLDKMHALYVRTQTCLDVLHRKSNAVAARLQHLSKTKQAVNAYGFRQNNHP